MLNKYYRDQADFGPKIVNEVNKPFFVLRCKIVRVLNTCYRRITLANCFGFSEYLNVSPYFRRPTCFRLSPFSAKQSWPFSVVPFKRVRAKKRLHLLSKFESIDWRYFSASLAFQLARSCWFVRRLLLDSLLPERLLPVDLIHRTCVYYPSNLGTSVLKLVLPWFIIATNSVSRYY